VNCALRSPDTLDVRSQASVSRRNVIFLITYF
jgi:hypothetical protein